MIKRARIILESLNTNISAAELYRKHNISPPTFYQWKEPERFNELVVDDLNIKTMI
ncbi:MAG: transposase [Nitrosopumilus sp.]|nr:transposase [Nitrosopumilus sp.]